MPEGRRKLKTLAQSLYAGTVRRAREPVFFVKFAVADTPDGRFDLLTLHAWLALGRVAQAGMPGLSQALVDTVFDGFETALRAQAAGDVAAVTGLKRFADAFYGRLQAYGGAKDETALAAVLVRNLYRLEAADAGPQTKANALRLAGYVLEAKNRLETWDPRRSPLDFGPLPG